MSVINRNCVICDMKDYTDLFVFSKEYTSLIENDTLVRRDLNEKYGPHTIVKCNNCDCKYVKNVVNGISQNSTETHVFESQRSKEMIIEQNKDFFNEKIKDKLFENRIYKLKLLESLSDKNFKEMSILDYGCGLGEYPKLSEILGFKKIVAFDPMYTDDHQKSYEKSGFKYIKAIKNIDQLSKNSKFDIIVCTAVIEHAISPRKIFSDLKKISGVNTLILFSNPVMDIEKDVSNIKKLVDLKSNEIKTKRYLHYHLGHINYMLGKQVSTLVSDFGLKILPIYPNNSKKSFLVKLKKIYVKIFPQSTRTEYVLRNL
jgi:2-polyprenyl-3-methyl-5-hydroxy-6-metoxy-1,4-benzoquinol methylase